MGGEPLTLFQWLLLTAMIVLASGALCFLVPASSHRMLRPRKKRLLDDDLAAIAEAGQAIGTAEEADALAEGIAAAEEDQDSVLEKDEQQDEGKKKDDVFVDKSFPERLLMLRVRVVRYDEDIDGKEGVAVSYDRQSERYTVCMTDGSVARIGIEYLEPVNSLEVLTVKVDSATEVRMREEAQARVQGRLNVYMVLTLGARHMRTRRE